MPWRGWESMENPVRARLGAGVSSWAPGRLDLFMDSENGNLWHRIFDNGRWSNWENLGGQITSQPAAVSRMPNSIDVVARGDEAMLVKSWDGTRWSDFMNERGLMASGPSISSGGPNRMFAFHYGHDNAVWWKPWSNGGWGDWNSVGGSFQPIAYLTQPACISRMPNTVEIFAVQPDQRLFSNFYNGTQWTGWTDQNMQVLPWGVGLASWGPTHQDLFTVGSEQDLFWRSYENRKWSDWVNLGQPGPLLAGTPAAVSWGPGRIDVFVRSPDGGIYHNWFQ